MCLTDAALLHAETQVDTPRLGVNRFAPTYPLGVYPCKDGWLGITVLSPAQWESFCSLLELDELAQTPLFHISMNRLEAADLIEPMILEKLQEHSAEELFIKDNKPGYPWPGSLPWRNSLKSISTSIVMLLAKRHRPDIIIKYPLLLSVI